MHFLFIDILLSRVLYILNFGKAGLKLCVSLSIQSVISSRQFFSAPPLWHAKKHTLARLTAGVKKFWSPLPSEILSPLVDPL